MSLSTGARLGPYEITGSLGQGGMGQVYRARHRKLARDVAIKVLPDALAADPERLSRLEREAKLASALDHPNIVTIYDICEEHGTTFIAMELVRGRTLRELVHEGPLPLETVSEIAQQIASGLAAAHAAGILHRDLKPDNVMVASGGCVKILDFGLARQVPPAGDAGAGPTRSTIERLTSEGAVMGTPQYMSPEQLSGGDTDHRSDQFAFGLLVYELLAGRPAFDAPTLQALVTAILSAPAPPLGSVRRGVPKDLARLIARSLEKDPADRHPSMAEVCRELRQIDQKRERARHGFRARLRRPAVAAPLALLCLVAVAAAVWWVRGAGRRWARDEAPGEIAARIERGRLFDAYELALRARRLAPAGPEIDRLLDRFTIPLHLATDPPGAEVAVRSYMEPDAPWIVLGTTPLPVRVPYAAMRWRIRKEGFRTYEGAPYGEASLLNLVRGLKLEPEGVGPPGMVRVPASMFTGGPMALELPNGGPAVPLDGYWLDRYEVTNAEFKRFVDAGGYANRQYWTELFAERGEAIAPDEALRAFRDRTGRPGPATWSFGTFPEGAEDMPVGGVSWHEALAYCRFAGGTLPTIYHWYQAGGQEQLSDILRMSNFEGNTPAPRGSFQGLGAYGTYDMAGNVREWCWNRSGGGERYALGGDCRDAPYVYRHLVARDPLDRAATNGIRCAAYDAPPAEPLLAPVDPRFTIETPEPVSDEVFAIYRSLYDYDPSPLEARTEEVDDSPQYWRRETVSYRTAYGERMQAFLFLPRNAAPPYQAVIWFPGGDVHIYPTSERLASPFLFDFIPRTGRALVYPVYQGMYERAKGPPVTPHQPNDWRDLIVRYGNDLSRTIDYLETRDDVDGSKLAFYGFSGGATNGPVLTAVERRFKASILLGGGLIPVRMRPEVDPAIFAPRSTVPTLMVNGENDFILPYDISQKPFLDLLGAAPGDKRLARLEGGHIPSNRQEMVREILDWLDRQLGTVQPVPVQAAH